MRPVGAAVLVWLLMGAPAGALEYRYSATPGYFVPYGINDSGTMAGTLYRDNAAILRDGVITQFADWLIPSGINNLERVVSWQSTGSFVYDGIELAEVVIPDAIHVTAEDINDQGMIVGHYREALPPWTKHAFVVFGGVVQSIDHPAYDGGRRQDLWFFGNNNRGEIVGSYHGDAGTEGFLFHEGVFTPLQHQVPQDINDQGQIIGNRGDRGFLDTAGEMIDIVFPGAIITAPRSINNLGQIVGYYQLANDPARYGFVASPVIPASVSVNPRSLPRPAGGVLEVTVELPPPHATSEIVSLAMEGADGYPIEAIGVLGVRDRDRDGIGDTTFRFDAAELTRHLEPWSHAIVVSGTLRSGVFVEGVAHVKVMGSHDSAP